MKRKMKSFTIVIYLVICILPTTYTRSLNFYSDVIEKLRRKRSVLPGDENRVLNIPIDTVYSVGLDYATDLLHDAHTRVRRLAGSNNEPLYLSFNSHNRTFNLELFPDMSLIHLNKKLDNRYNGKLVGEPHSRVFGFVYNGTFEGRIYTEDKHEFAVDATRRHPNVDPKFQIFHSMIYEAKDVVNLNSANPDGAPIDSVVQVKEDSPSSSSSSSEQQHNRKRQSTIDPTKLECPLFIAAEYTFINWAGDENQAQNLMINHVNAVKVIYEATDFDNDGTPEGITFGIQTISAIYEQPNCRSNFECGFSSDIPANEYIDKMSLNLDYANYCLAYFFQNRDYGGLLGVAYMPGEGFLGGICETVHTFNSVQQATNIGWVSSMTSQGNFISTLQTDLVLAHEIGHNFGGEHDNPSSSVCSPGSPNGNFIMFPSISLGSSSNNNKFSSCSKPDMHTILLERQSRCFVTAGSTVTPTTIPAGTTQAATTTITPAATTRTDPTATATNPAATTTITTIPAPSPPTTTATTKATTTIDPTCSDRCRRCRSRMLRKCSKCVSDARCVNRNGRPRRCRRCRRCRRLDRKCRRKCNC